MLTARPALKHHVSNANLVRSSCTLAKGFVRGPRMAATESRSGAATNRLRPARSPVCATRASDQRLLAGLAELRPVHCWLHRSVVSYELPKKNAQRPLRRCSGRWRMRGQAGYGLRLGAGVGRQQTSETRRSTDPGGAAAGRPSTDRSLRMAPRAAPQESRPDDSRRQ